ncbi:mobilization protein, partial [Lactococcus lactis]|nr:mobilization protein [Lactococcus lactis]
DTDIIKERLDSAIDVSSSFHSLSRNLALVGITPVKGKRKGADIIKFKLNADKKAYTDRKLGEAFSLESIQSRLSRNQAKYANISPGSIVRKTSAFSTYAKQQGIAEVPSVDLSYFDNNKIIQDKKETKTQPELTPKPRHKTKSVQSEVALSVSEEPTNVETPEPYAVDMLNFVDINKYDGIFDNDNKEKYVTKPKQHVEPPKQPVRYSDGDKDFYTEMMLEDQEASKNRHVAKPKQKHKEDDFEL